MRVRRAAGAAIAGVVLATTLVTVARNAHGQACCASAGLIVPTRLRSYEDVAVGLQARGRSVFGAFNAGGTYAAGGAGESEWALGQDFFAVARLLGRGQLALLVPFVETWRAVPGASSAGGGVGDVAMSARWDVVETGERHPVPGVALLLGLTFPTGTAPEEAGDSLAAGSTGQGSFEGTAGVGLEQAWQPYFVAATFTAGLRTSRQVGGVRQSFAPRLTGLLAVGRMLPRGATIGVFTTAMLQGQSRDDRGAIAASELSLLTVGAAGTFSVSDHWRLQGTLSGNPPLTGAGRNQPTGAGLSLSIMRLWL